MEPVGLFRRSTNVTIPITVKTAATPPMMPPTIAPTFLFRVPCDFVLLGTIIVLIGTLRETPCQE